MKTLPSPFPYFGGKSTVADLVWQRFGDVDTYVEPFFGSGAVLLANPANTLPVETVNDIDCMIANFWRAVMADPDAVAHHADWPAIENDLHARHAWLVNQKPNIIAAMEGNPDYYDAKIAGWWVWGMANWIGGEFCGGRGKWNVVDGLLVACDNGKEYAGQGVKRNLPHLGNAGQGVKRNLPHLGDAGQGVQRKSLKEEGEQGDAVLPQNINLRDYIRALATRLRRVRVCCGDWSRIVGPAVTWAGEGRTQQATCGVFLDPPYSAEAGRDMGIYAHESGDVAHDVREWCIANGNNRNMRIALCGYASEHDDLEAQGWEAVAWKAAGGYGDAQKKGRGSDNRNRERIWFSPHCLRPQLALGW